MSFELHVIMFIDSHMFRCAPLQWMLQTPGSTSYIGSTGKDKFGEEMKKNSKLAGVNVSFFKF